MSNEQEIREGNRLIAKFTGRTYQFVDDLFYHTSWDWLMPVVRKIADLLLNKDWDNLQEALSRWKPICNELEKVNIQNAWYCVVEFIKWYNQNNQT